MMFMCQHSVKIKKDTALTYKEIQQLVRRDKLNSPGFAKYFKTLEEMKKHDKKELPGLGKQEFSAAYKLHLSKFQRKVTAAITALIDYLKICHGIQLTLMIDARLIDSRKFEVDCFIKELKACYDVYGSDHDRLERRLDDREKHLLLKGLGYKVTIICPYGYGCNEEDQVIQSAENRCGIDTLFDVIKDILKETNKKYKWRLSSYDLDHKTNEVLKFMESDIRYDTNCFLVDWEVEKLRRLNKIAI